MGKKKGKKRVGLLLDETGSMQSRRIETIVAVNNYFETLRDEKAKVTFATFDTGQGVNFRNINIPAKKLVDLDETTYKPNALTPLYDAIGKMIGEMQSQVEDGDKVLITIITDGEENSSREFDLTKVRQLISKYEKDGWAFSYIGATPEAWGGGQAMGMMAGAILNVQGNQMIGAMNAQSRATSDYFSGRVSSRNFYDTSRSLVADDE